MKKRVFFTFFGFFEGPFQDEKCWEMGCPEKGIFIFVSRKVIFAFPYKIWKIWQLFGSLINTKRRSFGAKFWKFRISRVLGVFSTTFLTFFSLFSCFFAKTRSGRNLGRFGSKKVKISRFFRQVLKTRKNTCFREKSAKKWGPLP